MVSRPQYVDRVTVPLEIRAAQALQCIIIAMHAIRDPKLVKMVDRTLKSSFNRLDAEHGSYVNDGNDLYHVVKRCMKIISAAIQIDAFVNEMLPLPKEKD